MQENEDYVLLKQTLEYNPLTGVFTSLVNTIGRRLGEVAGGLTLDGYIRISFNGKQIPAHRLAFLYMTGDWPAQYIDHKDTDRTNNKWSNLREVNKTTNNRNKSMQKNNTSGVVGVSWDKKASKWYATICVEGKMKSLGRYTYKEDAIFARMTAEKDFGYWVDKVFDQA